jgi:cysteine desulfurase/selenocysteine lyase
MPVMEFFGVPGTARASLALYNDSDDIDRLIAAIEKARQVFA